MKHKHSLLLTIAIGIAGFSAQATVRTVAVAYGFYPNSFSANVGDTVKWLYIKGGPHNVISTIIPPSASSWSFPLTTGGNYSYKITVAGSYSYECTEHTGETGVFTVTAPTAVNDLQSGIASTAYPNPCKDKITLSFSQAVDAVSIYNMVGEKIGNIKLTNNRTETEINLSSFPSGIYFYSFYKEGMIRGTREIFKQ